ncbi:MAG TPA: CHASE3 domain-containing protein, partial [Nitrospiraceae bacterium]|nr:CHASE3 domain-containing protein [Nitrospiraceae bacterium]
MKNLEARRTRLGVYPAVTWAYLAGFLLIVAGVLLASLNLRRLGESSQEVMHTQRVLERLSASLGSLLDAETAQRGYLLTSDPGYLQSYHSARRQLPVNVSTLRQLTSDNPRQQRLVASYEKLVEERLALMQ